eukprot:1184336-Rhodomonas_salina.1
MQVSNTQTHPSHNVPADVQWQSDHVNLVGSTHSIHVRYSRGPCMLRPEPKKVSSRPRASPQRTIRCTHVEHRAAMAVYGRRSASFVINATTEQVAREMQVGPTYGAVVTARGNCSAGESLSVEGERERCWGKVVWRRCSGEVVWWSCSGNDVWWRCSEGDVRRCYSEEVVSRCCSEGVLGLWSSEGGAG